MLLLNKSRTCLTGVSQAGQQSLIKHQQSRSKRLIFFQYHKSSIYLLLLFVLTQKVAKRSRLPIIHKESLISNKLRNPSRFFINYANIIYIVGIFGIINIIHKITLPDCFNSLTFLLLQEILTEF